MQAFVHQILAIQHRINPLHLYCRFLDRGYARNTSKYCCKAYEIAVFSWLRRVLRSMLFLAVMCGGTEIEVINYRDGKNQQNTA